MPSSSQAYFLLHHQTSICTDASLTLFQEQINDETIELLMPYFAAPDFNYEAARKASGAVAGLCNWAEAMCTYHEVAKVRAGSRLGCES